MRRRNQRTMQTTNPIKYVPIGKYRYQQAIYTEPQQSLSARVVPNPFDTRGSSNPGGKSTEPSMERMMDKYLEIYNRQMANRQLKNSASVDQLRDYASTGPVNKYVYRPVAKRENNTVVSIPISTYGQAQQMYHKQSPLPKDHKQQYSVTQIITEPDNAKRLFHDSMGMSKLPYIQYEYS